MENFIFCAVTVEFVFRNLDKMFFLQIFLLEASTRFLEFYYSMSMMVIKKVVHCILMCTSSFSTAQFL